MNTAAHPSPGQAQLLAELDNLHVAPEVLAEALHAVVTASVPKVDVRQLDDAVLIAISSASLFPTLPEPALNVLAAVYQQSAKALGAAMATIPSAPSPQLARSLQAAENIWRHIEREFGLLTSVEVASLLSRKPTRTPAAHLRSDGKIVGVLRGNSFRFPGFQFDKAQGTVLPIMPKLISLARDNDRSDEDLMFWMTSPTSYFAEEDRPVDHLGEEERVLAAARDQFEGTW